MKNNVSIIIPAYNEEATIAEVLDKVLALEFVKQVVVVNDASKDRTAAIVGSYNDSRLELINHEKNAGKTAALKTGLSEVNGEITIIQDADLEYDPGELVYLCEPIWAGNADVVYGSRFLVRGVSRVLYFYHYLGNKVITFMSNLLTNKNMTDIETCYKAFKTPLITTMPIKSAGFGFEVEVTANISKTECRIFETPISYYGRTFAEGKKITYIDGIHALWYIFRFNLLPGKKVKNYVRSANEFLASTRLKQRATSEG